MVPDHLELALGLYFSGFMLIFIPALGLKIGAVMGRFTPGVGVALGSLVGLASGVVGLVLATLVSWLAGDYGVWRRVCLVAFVLLLGGSVAPIAVLPLVWLWRRRKIA